MSLHIFTGWLIEAGHSYNLPFIVSGIIGVLGCGFFGAALILKRRLWYDTSEEDKPLL